MNEVSAKKESKKEENGRNEERKRREGGKSEHVGTSSNLKLGILVIFAHYLL